MMMAMSKVTRIQSAGGKGASALASSHMSSWGITGSHEGSTGTPDESVGFISADFALEYACIAGRYLRWDADKKTWIDQRDGSSWSISFTPQGSQEPEKEQNDVRSR
jgi:hypothetical protein